MIKDHSDEVKELINRYKKDIIFGKDINFLIRRIKISREEIEREITGYQNLTFVEKQVRDGEVRYSLFFTYSKRKGRKYVLTFRDKNIRIITIFPLGRRTLKRYTNKGLNTEYD